MITRKAKRISNPPTRSKKQGFGYEMPPDIALVRIYFDQKGFPEQADKFYNHYDDLFWRSPRGARYRNWKVLASDWLFNYQQEQKLRQRQFANRLLN